MSNNTPELAIRPAASQSLPLSFKRVNDQTDLALIIGNAHTKIKARKSWSACRDHRAAEGHGANDIWEPVWIWIKFTLTFTWPNIWLPKTAFQTRQLTLKQDGPPFFPSAGGKINGWLITALSSKTSPIEDDWESFDSCHHLSTSAHTRTQRECSGIICH